MEKLKEPIGFFIIEEAGNEPEGVKRMFYNWAMDLVMKGMAVVTVRGPKTTALTAALDCKQSGLCYCDTVSVPYSPDIPLTALIYYSGEKFHSRDEAIHVFNVYKRGVIDSVWDFVASV